MSEAQAIMEQGEFQRGRSKSQKRPSDARKQHVDSIQLRTVTDTPYPVRVHARPPPAWMSRGGGAAAPATYIREKGSDAGEGLGAAVKESTSLHFQGSLYAQRGRHSAHALCLLHVCSFPAGNADALFIMVTPASSPAWGIK